MRKSFINPVLLFLLLHLNAGCGSTPGAAKVRLQPPADLPPSWVAEFIEEPVFNSTMLKIEAGTEHKHTVILAHGLGQEGHKIWSPLIPVLEKKYHVLTFDLPGFGRSEVPPGRYSPDNYARLIAWLDRRYAKSEAAVIGHSMGGAIALHYAAQYPDRVSRLVLVSVAGILEKTAYAKSNARLQGGENRGLTDRWIDQVNNVIGRLIEWATPDPDPLEALRRSNDTWNMLLGEHPNANAALGLITHDFSRDLDGFPHDTVLIWGEKDPVSPLRIAHLLNGRLPRSELHIIPDATHVPMRSHTLQFNAMVEHALHTELNPDDPLPRSTASDAVLECDGENGGRYSGHYKRIVMNYCIGATLHDVSAESMELTDSIVTITNARIGSTGVALTASNSEVTITSAEIRGDVAVLADDSRLDFAGVTLAGKQAALKAGAESRLVASISEIRVGSKRCHAHGVYEIRDGTLDSLLSNDCGYETLI